MKELKRKKASTLDVVLFEGNRETSERKEGVLNEMG